MSQRIPLTGDPVARSARAAARRLATNHGPELEAQVEASLQARRTDQYLDPVALGSLIVSVATLAWTVYTDLRARTAAPRNAEITERVRADLPTDDPAPAELDQVIEVVVEEITGDTEG